MTDAARSCFGKNRYATEQVAKDVASRCFQERGHWLRVYPCTECGGWHLSHKQALPPAGANWRPPEMSKRARAMERQQSRRRRRR